MHARLRNSKDGDCFITATLAGTQRRIIDVLDVSVLVYDIDGAMTLDDVHKRVKKFGQTAFVYTTYSHRSVKGHVDKPICMRPGRKRMSR